ncbi:hypothetical protein N7G274_009139 [Stereocaulon virgatum]|uniref:Uncharacterized protein n=1 Tax=Stereocaulon virgatum TaxID=373712 RepID=A0ABR3ZZM0_9LECA
MKFWHNRCYPEPQPNQAIAELAGPTTAPPETSEAGLSKGNPDSENQQIEAFDSDDDFICQDDAIAASLLEQEQEDATISTAIRPESSRAAQRHLPNRRGSFLWNTPDLGGDLYDVSSDEEGRQRGPRAALLDSTDQAGEQVEDHDVIVAAPTGAEKAVEEFGSDYSVENEN